MYSTVGVGCDMLGKIVTIRQKKHKQRPHHAICFKNSLSKQSRTIQDNVSLSVIEHNSVHFLFDSGVCVCVCVCVCVSVCAVHVLVWLYLTRCPHKDSKA